MRGLPPVAGITSSPAGPKKAIQRPSGENAARSPITCSERSGPPRTDSRTSDSFCGYLRFGRADDEAGEDEPRAVGGEARLVVEQRETDRRVAAIPGIQSHGLVGADGADDHG